MPVRNIRLQGNKLLQRINRRRKLLFLNIALRFLQQIIQRVGNFLPPRSRKGALRRTLSFVGRILFERFRASVRRERRTGENRGSTNNKYRESEQKGSPQITSTPQLPRPRTIVSRRVPHPRLPGWALLFPSYRRTITDEHEPWHWDEIVSLNPFATK